MKTNPLDIEFLNECFLVDETVKSGLVWKERPLKHFKNERSWKMTNTRCVGKEAGHLQRYPKGVRRHTVKIPGKRIGISTSRIVWALANQKDPGCMYVDHINRDQQDNRAENLRLVTSAQNSMNRNVHCNNKVGVNGVHFRSGENKWRALIKSGGKSIFIGVFDKLDDAISARRQKEIEIYGQFSAIKQP